MTTRTRARIYRGPTRPHEAGACTVCHRLVSITSTGRRWGHKDQDGNACVGSGVRVTPRPVTADMLSAAQIVVPREPQPPTPGMQQKQKYGKGARPSPTGHCHSCERAITGERLYCGPCFAMRGR